MAAVADDRTVAYAAEMQPRLEELRQVTAQLAGLLVLAASGARTAVPDHPMLLSAERVFAEAAAAVRSASAVPEAALEHRTRLLEAVGLLGAALEQARRGLGRVGEPDVAPILAPLRAAHICLQRAEALLPGCAPAFFAQACCAHHSAPPRHGIHGS